jgi:transposase
MDLAPTTNGKARENSPARRNGVRKITKYRLRAIIRKPGALPQDRPVAAVLQQEIDFVSDGINRHGTITLFAALNVLDGQVIAQSQHHHRHIEWLRFLRQIDRETPKNKDLHLICDNYATHKHPKVRAWLEKDPRFHMHFTPISASWLNMVERFFRGISTDRLERGVFRSVPELTAAIEEYIALHNNHPKPFVWTAKANDILQKVIRANRHLGSKNNEALH